MTRIAFLPILAFAALTILGMAGCRTDNDFFVKMPMFLARSDTIPGVLSPKERMELIRKKGEYGRNAEPEMKTTLLEHLTEEYVTSHDPNIRKEVVLAVSLLNTDGAFELMKYATKDESPEVRRTACREIEISGAPEAASTLRFVLKNDYDKDVRLQAAKSLGAFKDEETKAVLGSVLDEKQTLALQYQAMQSLKSCTGQDYGNDAHRWKQYLAGETPDPLQTPSIAERLNLHQLPMF